MKGKVLVALRVLTLSIVFCPAIFSLSWHVFYGREIEYAGKRIPVPRRWYAHVERDSVQLSKLPLTVFFLDEPRPVWSYIKPIPGHVPHPPSEEELYKSFEATYWTIRGRGSDEVSGPIRISTSEGNVICMKSASHEDKDRYKATASCLLYRGTWEAEFVGDEREFDTFIQMIRRITTRNS